MDKRILLFLVVTLLLNIGFSKTLVAQDENTKTYQGFSSNDATCAIDAFNTAYYDTSRALFYFNSTHTNNPWINTLYSQIWTQPIFWDMIMNAYKRTKDPKYLKQVNEIYKGGFAYYDGYNWRNHKVWFIYDDMMWWIISLARGFEITGNSEMLSHSIVGFKYVYQEAFDPEGNGMYWDFKHTGKMACINYPTIIAAMTLYNITKEQEYLDKAKALYEYSQQTFFKDGKVADSWHPSGVDWKTHVYNQATCIGSAAMLYIQSGDVAYLNDAVQAAAYTRDNMTYSDGILNYETGVEQGIYTAIFSQYISLLINDCGQTQFLGWMRKNIDAAWNNRREGESLTFVDAVKKCPQEAIQAYDGSACPALMQVIPPLSNSTLID
jgi:predicted alpha-1,6-mannanase (GH76 family)